MTTLSTASIELDIEDLVALLRASKSPRNQGFLRLRLDKLKKEKKGILAKLEETKEEKVEEKKPAPAKSLGAPPLKWTVPPMFYWDQNKTKVTVGVRELEGVGAVKEGVTCEFTPSSFDLKIKGLNGKNYRLHKEGLQHTIAPKQSKFRVKANKVLLYLYKEEQKWGAEHWTDLVASEQDRRMKKNPTAGLMDVMKNLYSKGDDKTKAMIEKTMRESQAKTGMGFQGMQM